MICERYAHCRRKFCEAKDIEPERAEAALEMIGALYAIEEKIRQQQLAGAAKRAVRQAESRPIVDRFFNWVDQQFERQGLLPSSPLTTALAYAGERREGLRVYLDDPDVAIDTNHLERALRPIPLGKKNWMFAWTELGAKQIGIVQSLIVTCRLHGHQSVPLPGRRAPARRSTSCIKSERTYTENVEATVCGQSAALSTTLPRHLKQERCWLTAYAA
jgi:hypothetical protein